MGATGWIQGAFAVATGAAWEQLPDVICDGRWALPTWWTIERVVGQAGTLQPLQPAANLFQVCKVCLFNISWTRYSVHGIT
jgi:hypothetical protein